VFTEGLAGADAPGIRDEASYAAAHCRRTGRDEVPALDFFVVFPLFRWAAVAADVRRRALDGNAANAGTLATGGKFRALAQAGSALARHTWPWHLCPCALMAGGGWMGLAR